MEEILTLWSHKAIYLSSGEKKEALYLEKPTSSYRGCLGALHSKRKRFTPPFCSSTSPSPKIFEVDIRVWPITPLQLQKHKKLLWIVFFYPLLTGNAALIVCTYIFQWCYNIENHDLSILAVPFVAPKMCCVAVVFPESGLVKHHIIISVCVHIW
jgi:hypothetical protein